MPVPDGFYEATFLFRNDASPRVCTFSLGFVRIDLTSPTAVEAAQEIKDVTYADGMPFDNAEMINDWFIDGVSVAKGTSTGDIVGQALQTLQGTVVDSCVPSNCALIVKKNTALGGRRYRGRMFVPPVILNEGAVDAAGNILSSPLALIQANFDQWHAALIAADWGPCLMHQGAGAPAPTLITSFTCDSLIGTQRRRMRG
jgi:hypothetical protein